MDAIALDVVILPPQSVSAMAVSLNQQLRHDDPRITLDPAGALPHISLCMFSLPRSELTDVWSRVQEVAGRHGPLQLQLSGISYGGFDEHNSVSSLSIEPSRALTEMHRQLCDAMAGDCLDETLPQHFQQPQQVDENSRNYVQQFFNQHAYAHFNPHITLGFGRLQAQVEALSFTADTLAVCQLGPFCTCPGILHECRL